MNTLRIVALTAPIFLHAAAFAQDVVLVKDGQAASVIVTADEPNPVQRQAAKELQDHLKKIAGADVPVLAERDLKPSDAAKIYVGQSRALKALGIDTAALPPETFIVRTVDGALVLAGDDGGAREGTPFYGEKVRAGTLYAVVDFLQDQLGCRWLWPGPTGEFIPRRATIRVGPLSIQETPRMIRRHFRPGVRPEERRFGHERYPRTMRAGLDARYETLELDEWTWLKRLRMGESDRPEYGHAFTDWLDRHRETRPEMFAMQADGRRGLANPQYPSDMVKMCLSSDALVDMLIGQFRARREKDPAHRWLNACENDGGLGFCLCPPCKALDVTLDDALREKLRARGWGDAQIDAQYRPGEDGLPYSLSNRYFHFFNKVARRLAEVAPDAYVVAYAYVRYLHAPVDLKLEPNILVGLIGFDNYPMTPEVRRRELDALQAWRDAGAKALFHRPNSFYFSIPHGVPWDGSTQMGEDFKELVAGGIIATDFDRLNGHWSTAARTYYIMARLHWDSGAGVEDLKKEFASGFGPAAGAVGRYYDHWEKVFHAAYTRPDLMAVAKEADEFGGRIGLAKALPLLLSDADFARGRELLDEAAAAAEGEPGVADKLQVLRLGLRHGELMREGARFTIDLNYSMPTRYEAHWPTVQAACAVRETLAQLRAHNPYWLYGYELVAHDAWGMRLHHDFQGRPYRPVMSPPREDWKFIPDPRGVGEKEGWFAQRMTPARALYGFEHPSYRHLFFSTWDHYQPVQGWMRTTGEKGVVNGWYQIDFAIPKEDLRGGSVLYFPYIKGAARIWIGERLMREVTPEQGAADAAITIDPAEAGIRPDKAFRLTIKVHSPDAPGGLIGPVYVARPAER